jgi:hypothetical protein
MHAARARGGGCSGFDVIAGEAMAMKNMEESDE